jgi:hypothetical protein
MSDNGKKIYNEASGKWVLKDGKIGKEILKKQAEEKLKNKSLKSPKVKPSNNSKPSNPSKAKECKEGKIYNESTGKCVKIDGRIGKKILALLESKKVKTKKSPEKKDKSVSNKEIEKVKECEEGKIYNTDSKRCVLKDGKVGKLILKKQAEESLKNKSLKSPKVKSPPHVKPILPLPAKVSSPVKVSKKAILPLPVKVSSPLKVKNPPPSKVSSPVKVSKKAILPLPVKVSSPLKVKNPPPSKVSSPVKVSKKAILPLPVKAKDSSKVKNPSPSRVSSPKVKNITPIKSKDSSKIKNSSPSRVSSPKVKNITPIKSKDSSKVKNPSSPSKVSSPKVKNITPIKSNDSSSTLPSIKSNVTSPSKVSSTNSEEIDIVITKDIEEKILKAKRMDECKNDEVVDFETNECIKKDSKRGKIVAKTILKYYSIGFQKQKEDREKLIKMMEGGKKLSKIEKDKIEKLQQLDKGQQIFNQKNWLESKCKFVDTTMNEIDDNLSMSILMLENKLENHNNGKINIFNKLIPDKVRKLIGEMLKVLSTREEENKLKGGKISFYKFFDKDLGEKEKIFNVENLYFKTYIEDKELINIFMIICNCYFSRIQSDLQKIYNIYDDICRTYKQNPDDLKILLIKQTFKEIYENEDGDVKTIRGQIIIKPNISNIVTQQPRNAIIIDVESFKKYGKFINMKNKEYFSKIEEDEKIEMQNKLGLRKRDDEEYLKKVNEEIQMQIKNRK